MSPYGRESRRQRRSPLQEFLTKSLAMWFESVKMIVALSG
jgi:hypothetical protein